MIFVFLLIFSIGNLLNIIGLLMMYLRPECVMYMIRRLKYAYVQIIS
jgi:hypothetical protein